MGHWFAFELRAHLLPFASFARICLTLSWDFKYSQYRLLHSLIYMTPWVFSEEPGKPRQLFTNQYDFHIRLFLVSGHDMGPQSHNPFWWRGTSCNESQMHYFGYSLLSAGPCLIFCWVCSWLQLSRQFYLSESFGRWRYLPRLRPWEIGGITEMLIGMYKQFWDFKWILQMQGFWNLRF